MHKYVLHLLYVCTHVLLSFISCQTRILLFWLRLVAHLIPNLFLLVVARLISSFSLFSLHFVRLLVSCPTCFSLLIHSSCPSGRSSASWYGHFRSTPKLPLCYLPYPCACAPLPSARPAQRLQALSGCYCQWLILVSPVAALLPHLRLSLGITTRALRIVSSVSPERRWSPSPSPSRGIISSVSPGRRVLRQRTIVVLLTRFCHHSSCSVSHIVKISGTLPERKKEIKSYTDVDWRVKKVWFGTRHLKKGWSC